MQLSFLPPSCPATGYEPGCLLTVCVVGVCPPTCLCCGCVSVHLSVLLEGVLWPVCLAGVCPPAFLAQPTSAVAWNLPVWGPPELQSGTFHPLGITFICPSAHHWWWKFSLEDFCIFHLFYSLLFLFLFDWTFLDLSRTVYTIPTSAWLTPGLFLSSRQFSPYIHFWCFSPLSSGFPCSKHIQGPPPKASTVSTNLLWPRTSSSAPGNHPPPIFGVFRVLHNRYWSEVGAYVAVREHTQSPSFWASNRPNRCPGYPSVTPSIFGDFCFYFLHISLIPCPISLIVGSFESPCSPLSYDIYIIIIGSADHPLFQLFLLFPDFCFLVICCLPSNHHYHSSSSTIHPIIPQPIHHPSLPPSSSSTPRSSLLSPSSSSRCVKISGFIGLGGSWIELYLSVGYPGVVVEVSSIMANLFIYLWPPCWSPSIQVMFPLTDAYVTGLLSIPIISSSSSCLLFKTCFQDALLSIFFLPASYGIFKTFLKISLCLYWVGSVFGIGFLFWLL